MIVVIRIFIFSGPSSYIIFKTTQKIQQHRLTKLEKKLAVGIMKDDIK